MGSVSEPAIPSSGKSDAHFAENAMQAAARPRVCLLYHELRDGASAYMYAMETAEFSRQVELVRRVQHGTGEGYVPELTFDDGHRSNLTQALPVLERAHVRAHFFITTGWTGVRSEYMDWGELRQLASAGHAIGAHGMTHALLTHCHGASLEQELRGAREMLEDGLGQEVTTMSLPGGRYDRRVLEGCIDAGYTRVFTSEPRVWGIGAAEMPERVGRLNIRGDATVDWMERLLDPATGTLARLERIDKVKSAAKRLLGDALYRRVWSMVNRADGSEADELRMAEGARR